MSTFKSNKVRASVRGAIGTAVAVPLLFSAMPAMAQSQQEQMQQLRDQIQQMQQRFDELQSQQEEMKQAQESPRSEERLVSKSEDGEGFMVGDTNVKINGYFKFDAIYDFEDDHDALLGPSDAIGTLNAKGTDSPGDGDFGVTVKQTRLKIATTTPTEFGDLGGYIEMDFYGKPYDESFDSAPSPRVRRAYLTFGNWLIGRDWSTFSDFNYGTTLNFYGPQAQLFERQAQVRYTMDAGENTSVDFALENPGGGSVLAGDGGTAASAGPDGLDGTADDVAATPADPNFRGLEDGSDTENTLPDVVVRLKTSSGPFSFQAAAIGRYLTTDINQLDGDGSDEDSVVGYGLNLGGSLSLPTNTTFMLSSVYGKGIGKYVYAPAGGADAYVTSDGDLEALERYGFIATISQELTSTLTTNLIYGKAYSENPDDFVGSTDALHDSSSSAHVNLLYTPVDPLTFGIEYNRVEYETQGGVDADAQNVQFSTIYNF
ncbi:putative outer membrane protein [Salinisphaera shabanensis E1L3A]|uniref:Outer membrane protein n=1 Tax=Salinisphaera shabanensis E1L3A TaxID=1033802 RepID=U2EQL3_9GAMM|nr:DcaP family trimeric outer membrane transporter [Salinisphaera shabanensis]ERJ20347.1 putative outer membrane protein [Salinisphaera shabanensis E1L3A]